MLSVALASATAGGCTRAPVAAAPPVDLAAMPDLAEPPIPVVSALRCEECHGKIAARWRVSAHARADRAPLYTAMLAKAGEGAGCARCHAPFVGHAEASEPGAHEGVNCDTCHSIAKVDATRAGAGFSLQTRDNVKFGPLCDAKDHYFHKMGCSPLHGEAQLCAACHLYYRTVRGGELPVFTEYEEWRDGPVAEDGIECQSCHMPAVRGLEVARGWKPARPFGHDHGLLQPDGKLRTAALKLRLEVSPADGGSVHVAATVSNVGAGHAVPSGMPGRRVVLRLVCRDKDGRVEGRAEREYARVLADDSGRERPFYAATHVVSDERIAPRASRSESFALAATQPGVVEVQLVWREMPDAWRGELGVDSVSEQVLLQAKVPFTVVPPGAHAAAPRIVTLEPAR